MKTRYCLFSVAAFFLALVLLHPALGQAETDGGYSIEVKVAPKEGEAKVTRTTGIALDRTDRVKVPLALAHSEGPATLEMHFDFSDNSVFVEIVDLHFVREGGEGKLHGREFFEGDMYFEFGKEKTICETATEAISFTLTAPPTKKAEKEGGDDGAKKGPASIDVSRLEVSFQKSRGRATIYGAIYNPTERSISQLVVRVTAPASGEFEGLDRLYADRVSVAPMSDSSIQIDTHLPELPEGVEYEFSLDSAR